MKTTKCVRILGITAIGFLLSQTFTHAQILDLESNSGVLTTGGAPASNGDPVTTWVDQSGSGNNVSDGSQGGATTTSPTYLTGQADGDSVVNFANGTDRLQASSALLTGTTDFDIFAVIELPTTTANGERTISANFGDGNFSGLEFYINNDHLSLYLGGFVDGSTVISSDTLYLVEAERSGGDVTLRLDGTVDGTGTLAGSIGSSENWTIGNAPDYAVSANGIDIAAEQVYDTALTDTQRAGVEEELDVTYLGATAVPEPGTMALIGMSAIVAGLAYRRRAFLS